MESVILRYCCHSMISRMFHCEIPICGISQIDCLEAGKITYEYPNLLVVRKFVRLTFAHQIRW